MVMTMIDGDADDDYDDDDDDDGDDDDDDDNDDDSKYRFGPHLSQKFIQHYFNKPKIIPTCLFNTYLIPSLILIQILSLLIPFVIKTYLNMEIR